MMRARSLLLVLGALAALVTCARDVVSPHAGAVVVRAVFPSGSAQGEAAPMKLPVDSMSVRVHGPGMSPRSVVVPVVDGVAEGRVDDVPAGKGRIVTALAWSAEPRFDLYRGEDTVTVEAGKVTEAMLVMRRIAAGPAARLVLDPDSVRVGQRVIADASASFDPYGPDDSLSFRFTLNGAELRGWSHASRDTFVAPPKGVWRIGVTVRASSGAQADTACLLRVLNTPPSTPSSPLPSPGDTVWSLLPTLRWSCEDADRDVIRATVWWGEDSLAVREGRAPATSQTVTADSALVTVSAQTHYYWRVVVTDGEASVEGEVWDFWTARRLFSVEPDSRSFPCGTDAHTVTLQALAAVPLAWSATAGAPWLSVSPPSGTLDATPMTVSIEVTRSGLAPGISALMPLRAIPQANSCSDRAIARHCSPPICR